MIIRNEKGLALPLVIMVMFVITLLGAAVLQYGVTDAMQVARDEKRMQAHYLARSGADAMAEHLIRNPAAIPDIVTRTAINMATGSLGAGKNFQLRVSGNAADGVAIFAEGNSRGVTANATLNLVSLSPSAIFQHAISTRQDLYANHSNFIVSGSLESGGKIHPPDNYSYPIRYNSYVWHHNKYRSPVIPTFNSAGQITVGNNQSMTLSGPGINVKYSSITVRNNARLTFETGGNDISVVVGRLVTDGNIFISGGGRLRLYITESARFEGPQQAGPGRITNARMQGNRIVDATPASLFIILEDRQPNPVTLEIQANHRINGYIYGPNANVFVQSAKSTIRGAVIANIHARHDRQPDSIGDFIHVPLPDDTSPIFGITILRRSGWTQ